MVNVLLIVGAVLIVTGICFIVISAIPKPTNQFIQYTEPIGPTQEQPYILESEVINGISRTS